MESLRRVHENQFVLPEIDDHYVEFVQEVQTEDAVDALSHAFRKLVRVHRENSMVPPKYGSDRQRSPRENATAGITRTLLRGDHVLQ